MLTTQTDHVVSCYACFGCAAGRRAVHVSGVPQEGMAVDVGGPSGLVEFTQDEPYDVDSRADKQRIPFQLSEVGCQLQSPLGSFLFADEKPQLVKWASWPPATVKSLID